MLNLLLLFLDIPGNFFSISCLQDATFIIFLFDCFYVCENPVFSRFCR